MICFSVHSFVSYQILTSYTVNVTRSVVMLMCFVVQYRQCANYLL